ncbi:cytochrome c distal domain protein [Candidatus Endolissoclinum faulkneri L2]|uniref:Cytochrome c distal domain protein n=1 Tax=Candidatus Endolissoclinum faulkneri L2 TaxID=1193729 RepID=K7Z687_9PROT|nr:cytochrome c family protein [Candidatus Endolissoclinum faulkneri]AFX99708.1 cytochrome c distal domain protein [Candidatus Endolissoclinum faulkneri L2]
MITINLLIRLPIIGCMLIFPSLAFAQDGDPVAGKNVFRKCQACHTVQQGQHRQGPSLYGVIGRRAGTAEGYKRYSEAMKNYGIIWDANNLNIYLENPKKALPGNKMPFVGLKNIKDRQDVISYLQQVVK